MCRSLMSPLLFLFCSLNAVVCLSQQADTGRTIVKTLDGKGQRSKTEIDQFILTQMDTLHIVGLSIALIDDSKVVYYKTFGMKDKEKGEKVDDRTLFEAASMSKPVFAYAVMKLVQRGILHLDTPLYKYYPYEDL